MKKIKLLLISFIAISSFLSCSNHDDEIIVEEETQRAYIRLNDRQEVLRDSSNVFAYKFYEACSKNVPDDNYAISPISASFALSMLANGASEEAQAEIISALGMKNFSIDELNEYNRLFVENLPKLDPKVSLYLANLLWTEDKVQPKQPFVDAMQQSYSSDVLCTDMTKAALAVNEWVKKATKGSIPQMLPNNTELKNFALVNAFTFHGNWLCPFEVKDTKEELFTNADGSKSKVKMMNAEMGLRYYEKPKLSMVAFPYGSGNGKWSFTLTVAMPAKGVSLDECMEEMLKLDVIRDCEPMPKNIKVKMPKIELSNNIDLIPVFKSLGINGVFSEGNLKGIAETMEPEEQLMVRLAQQSSAITFDEKGTVASSSTITSDMNGASGGIIKNGEFFMDCPFVFAIRTFSTNSILFMGKVTKL